MGERGELERKSPHNVEIVLARLKNKLHILETEFFASRHQVSTRKGLQKSVSHG